MRRRIFRRRSSKGIGEVPGTLHLDPEAPPPVIHVIAYGPEDCKEQEIMDVGSLRNILHTSPVTWVNVDGLSDVKPLTVVGEILELHPLALEDVVNVPQRPKALCNRPNSRFSLPKALHPLCYNNRKGSAMVAGRKSIQEFSDGIVGKAYRGCGPEFIWGIPDRAEGIPQWRLNNAP